MIYIFFISAVNSTCTADRQYFYQGGFHRWCPYIMQLQKQNVITRWIFISSMSHPSLSSIPLCLAIWQILLLPLLLYYKYKLNNPLCPKDKIHHVIVSIIFAVIVWYSITHHSNNTGVAFKISIATVVTTFSIVLFWNFSVVDKVFVWGGKCVQWL